MANYVFTKYAIEGKKDVLQKIADVINDGDGYTKTALDKLGVKYDEDEWEYLYRSEWETGAKVEERDGKTVLFFTQAYPWEQADIIDWTLREMGESDEDIYFLSELFEQEIHETNDSEGKYFPERYRVYTDEDDDDVYFLTKEEALAHIRKQYQLSDDLDDIEKIYAHCEENDLTCGFDEIIVI